MHYIFVQSQIYKLYILNFMILLFINFCFTCSSFRFCFGWLYASVYHRVNLQLEVHFIVYIVTDIKILCSIILPLSRS